MPLPDAAQKSFHTPLVVNAIDMSVEVKALLESSSRFVIDLDADESAFGPGTVKEETPAETLKPSGLPEVPIGQKFCEGITVYKMSDLASTKPPVGVGAPPPNTSGPEDAARSEAARAAKEVAKAQKAAKRAEAKAKRLTAAAEAAAGGADEVPLPGPPPPRRPKAPAAKRKREDSSGDGKAGRKKSVRACASNTLPFNTLPTRLASTAPPSPSHPHLQVEPVNEKENAMPAMYVKSPVQMYVTSENTMPAGGEKKDEGTMMYVKSPDGDSVQLRIKGEDTAPLNGASVDDKDQVLMLEKVTSAIMGTEFALIKAGRKKGYVRAAYLLEP